MFSPQHWPRDSELKAALLVYCTADRLVCVDAALRVSTWTWSGLPNGKGQPFTLGLGRTNLLPTRSLHMSNACINRSTLRNPGGGGTTSPSPPQDAASAPAAGCHAPSRKESGWLTGLKSSLGQGTVAMEPTGVAAHCEDETPNPLPRSVGRVHSCFALRTAFDGSPDSILSCGYWDHAVRRHSLDPSVKLSLAGAGTGEHEGPINCLSMTDGGSLLVTGGQDAKCCVWVVGNAAMAAALRDLDSVHISSGGLGGGDMVCVHVLYGHEAPVVSLAVSEVRYGTVGDTYDRKISCGQLEYTLPLQTYPPLLIPSWKYRVQQGCPRKLPFLDRLGPVNHTDYTFAPFVPPQIFEFAYEIVIGQPG